jgi:hypothetical protein
MTAFPNSLDNLKISPISPDVLLVRQVRKPARFSCCDGLLILPREGRNDHVIALDLNIEPQLVRALTIKYGPVSDYVNTHGHMDHIAHVHAWEEIGATVHAPSPEADGLLGLQQFYDVLRWERAGNFSMVEQFARMNLYAPCKTVTPFQPGDTLQIENFTLRTIPFSGHSRAHVGFLLPTERILHISCMGFDQPAPGKDGFGPWYGFENCDIVTYLEDIDGAQSIFGEEADFLTSSHAYIAQKGDTAPFDYMRGKIAVNQQKVDRAAARVGAAGDREEMVTRLLSMDLFFPKSKMNGWLLDLYAFWESWIIRHHLERSESLT